MDLVDIKFQCELIMEGLTNEVNGTIPSLTGFVDKKDAYTWFRAKRSLGVLANDGRSLMEAVSLVVSKLDPKTYPGSQNDLISLYSGVDQVRPAIAQLAALPDEPDADTVAMAASILKAISSLPPKAKDAILDLQGAVNERQRLSCT